jgi:zinc protease
MKHTLSLFSSLLLAASCALLAPAHGTEITQRYTLANGMTLIVQPDHRAPTAVHMVWVRVGAYDEFDGTSGVAHALEHMMFKGSKLLKAGDFSRRVAALGGRENAFTSYDNTGYYQQIPAARLEDVMKLEADRFATNRWPDAEFTKEIEVVKEERRMRTEDEPRAKLYEALNATAFMASPYRRPIIGWMSDLDAMKANDVRAFHQRWYTPANAAVVVVGDVNPARVKAWAEQYYGRIPARAVPARAIAAEPVQIGMKRVQVKASADQAYVALVYKVPPLRNATQPTAQDADAISLTVLAAVLDGYSGARLERALTQGTDRVADSAGAGNGLTGRGPQTFVLDGVPAPGKTAAQVEAALREQVARIAREGVSEAELQRVKTQWVAGEVYKRDSLFNQARELGSQWVLDLPADFDEQLLARLRAVTPQQVQDVAARYFGDDQLTVGELLPQPRDPNQPRRAAPAGDLR